MMISRVSCFEENSLVSDIKKGCDMVQKEYSALLCVERLEDRREIKNLLGKYAVCLHLCRYKEIFDTLWSRSEDVILGFRDGTYRGRASVAGYYTYRKEKTALGTRLLRDALPEQFQKMNEEESYGAGCLELKPVQTPVIEITEDGSRAEAWWYSQGTMTEITVGGPNAYWTFGSYHVTCVREEEEWRILALEYLEDIRSEVGQDWSCPGKMEEKEEFRALGELPMPEMEEPERPYAAYAPDRPFTKIPEPAHQTFYDLRKDELDAEEERTLLMVLARDEIEQLMGRRVLYEVNGAWEKELDELWVRTPAWKKNMCLGGTWGFYQGEDAVRGYYAKIWDTRQKEHPLGSAAAHPLRSPAIQIAADGESAKGIWYSLGHTTTGGNAAWVGQKVAADFVKEEGRWRIWHLCQVHDAVLTPGTDYGDQTPEQVSGKDPLEEMATEPTMPVKTHERLFCWTDDFPWMPEPYETMTPELEYSDTGFFARKKEEVVF